MDLIAGSGTYSQAPVDPAGKVAVEEGETPVPTGGEHEAATFAGVRAGDGMEEACGSDFPMNAVGTDTCVVDHDSIHTAAGELHDRDRASAPVIRDRSRNVGAWAAVVVAGLRYAARCLQPVLASVPLPTPPERE